MRRVRSRSFISVRHRLADPLRSMAARLPDVGDGPVNPPTRPAFIRVDLAESQGKER